MMFDQSPGNRGARIVEFGGAVRCLAQQHDLRIAEAVEKLAERLTLLGWRQRLGILAQGIDQPVRCGAPRPFLK